MGDALHAPIYTIAMHALQNSSFRTTAVTVRGSRIADRTVFNVQPAIAMQHAQCAR